MIPEQALFHLPEILTGSGYPRQRYEGGIVTAFSLALLQSLNGRNVPNPISCLHAERPFQGQRGWARGDTSRKRYLRSDLFLDLSSLPVGSGRLSAYGWRFNNWIEAKFFRKSTSNPQQNTGALLADLIRLLALVPNKDGPEEHGKKKTITGRYLLHVYEAFDPADYLSLNRQTGQGSELRKWLQPLVAGGPNKCPRIRLSDYESAGILREINQNLGDLELEFEATSWRVGPTCNLGTNARQYVCILSRIDAFTLWRNGARLKVSADRTIERLPLWSDVRREIREYVGRWISLKVGIEKQKPDPYEIEDQEDSD